MKLPFSLVFICFLSFYHSLAHGNQPKKPLVVFLCAEQEYETARTLPEFSRRYLASYQTVFSFATEQDPNVLSLHEPIQRADLLIVSVRRRALPDEQLEFIKQYVAAGKPIIGIRTASHAFSLRSGEPPTGHNVWPEFDQVVFGGNYSNHYANDLLVTITTDKSRRSKRSLLLRGVNSKQAFTSKGSLYKVSPLVQGTSVLAEGKVKGYPAEPIAWTFKREDGGKSFYTSLGHPSDFESDLLPKLLFNAIQWCLK